MDVLMQEILNSANNGDAAHPQQMNFNVPQTSNGMFISNSTSFLEPSPPTRLNYSDYSEAPKQESDFSENSTYIPDGGMQLNVESEVPSNESMWGSASTSQQLESSSAVDANQQETMSWQLGGPAFSLAIHSNERKEEPALSMFLPAPTIAVAPETNVFKIPATVPTKRRGRPAYKDIVGAEPKQIPSLKPKGKGGRRLKSRRKRLTMTKLRAPAASNKRFPYRAAPLTASTAIPTGLISPEDRAVRIKSLCQNCPEELSTSLQNAEATVADICKEAESFPAEIHRRIRAGTTVLDLEEELMQERKKRQEEEDAADIAWTETLYNKVQTVQLDLSVDADDFLAEEVLQSPLFINGYSDRKIQGLRSLMALPPIEKRLSPVKLAEESEEFLKSVGVTPEYLSPEDHSNYTTNENVEALKLENPSQSRSSKLNFSNRRHPKDISQDLYALLGKNAQPKAEKRALQRARRAAQTENVTEEVMESTFFDYAKSCLSISLPVVDVAIPEYHQVKDSTGLPTIEAKVAEMEIMKFYENFVAPCACKNHRHCDLCRDIPPAKVHRPTPTNVSVPSHAVIYEFCFPCRIAYPLDYKATSALHPHHRTEQDAPVALDCMYMWDEFVTVEEEKELLRCINQRTWSDGVCGTRKQHYGPIVDFQHKTVNLEKYTGLPDFARILVKRMLTHPGLSDHGCAALSATELMKDRGSCIQPHMDDEWLWGAHVVMLGLLADSVLTFSPISWEGKEPNIPVRVRVPRRALFVFTGDARYKWSHSMLSADVQDQQIILTFRELNINFTTGREFEVGMQLLKTAQEFRGEVLRTGDSF